MARMGGFDTKGLKELQRNLNKIKDSNLDAFIEECAKELAARLLRKVIKRTPVGTYGGMVEFDVDIPKRKVEFDTKSGEHVSFTAKARTKHVKFTPKESGKQGGTLRRGWTVGETKKEGNNYVIEIINPVEYASYVEYGHRTPNHKGWVKGRFMMTISEQEIEQLAPVLLEKKIQKLLEGCLK